MSKVPLCTKVAQDVKTSALTPQGEFLRWHHRLGHLSYKKDDTIMHATHSSAMTHRSQTTYMHRV